MEHFGPFKILVNRRFVEQRNKEDVACDVAKKLSESGDSVAVFDSADLVVAVYVGGERRP